MDFGLKWGKDSKNPTSLKISCDDEILGYLSFGEQNFFHLDLDKDQVLIDITLMHPSRDGGLKQIPFTSKSIQLQVKDEEIYEVRTNPWTYIAPFLLLLSFWAESFLEVNYHTLLGFSQVVLLVSMALIRYHKAYLLKKK